MISQKLPDGKWLLILYEHFNLQEIGDMFGYSLEAVRLRLMNQEGYKPYLYLLNRVPAIKELHAQGKSIGEIAQQVSLSRGQVYRLLTSHLGLTPNKHLIPIGCPNCETNPYARGICRNCYNRWIRKGKPDLPNVKAAYEGGRRRPIGPRKTETFRIRCTPEFRDLVDEMANNDGITRSEFLRQVIYDEAVRWGLIPLDDSEKAIQET